jgi:hypothetical protein
MSPDDMAPQSMNLFDAWGARSNRGWAEFEAPVCDVDGKFHPNLNRFCTSDRTHSEALCLNSNQLRSCEERMSPKRRFRN